MYIRLFRKEDEGNFRRMTGHSSDHIYEISESIPSSRQLTFLLSEVSIETAVPS
jgi:hypothetical protein